MHSRAALRPSSMRDDKGNGAALSLSLSPIKCTGLQGRELKGLLRRSAAAGANLVCAGLVGDFDGGRARLFWVELS